MRVAEDRPLGRRSTDRPGGKAKRKIRVPQNALLVRFLLHPAGKVFLATILLLLIAGLGVFVHFYRVYSKMIDERLLGGPYSTTARIFAAPEAVSLQDQTTPSDVAAALRRAGYNENRNNPVGSYTVTAESIDIFPGTDAYFLQEPATVKFAHGRITRIVSLRDNTDRPMYELEPELITNLYDRNREKQRVVRYEDIPPVLRNAILSAEDKRFFQHSGFDPIGIVRSAWVDVRSRKNAQGASTLSMQLARDMFLTPARNWRRKAAEMMITLQLEQKLTKQQIFEMYCNQVDLGYRGSFTIRGFGEAAQTYFGKDLKSLSLPEAATLASIVRGASYYNPYRHPERVTERRNAVLALMRGNGFITDREYGVAVETPLKVVSGPAESSDAPYFVDLLNDDLEKRFPGYDFQARSDKIYSTLDLNLQKAANEAVAIGMKQVDDIARKQKRFKNAPFVEPQCALIALDPHTGEIKALVGGRNYGASQLNRVLAERPTGSIFKPFVYAAAMNTAVAGGTRTLTPASIVVDEPTTFEFDGQEYTPDNFEHTFFGPVTLRKALAKSLNVATIKVAEMVGYGTVVNLAHRAGISEDVKATPAMAIGSYQAMPIEMAGAWTIFANHGVHVQPSFISLVKEPNGKVLLDQKPVAKPVLDPRVDYLVVNMLEEVMRTGTAAGVRARGFTAPAAGKTGTSHDAWFAGFTSDLLCIVWVGFDDYRQLDIEGAHAALPIWTEFMKRALQERRYADARPFEAPDGVVTATIDPESGMLATPQCPAQAPEVFIAGTEPVGSCTLHGGRGDHTTVSGWDVTSSSGTNPQNAGPQPSLSSLPPRREGLDAAVPVAGQNPPAQPADEKEEGLLRQAEGCIPMRAALLTILLAVAAPAQSSPSAQSSAAGTIGAEQRGDIYTARKMYREAIDAYRAGRPETAVLWNKIGIAYHQLGDLAAAKRSYERAIKLDRKFPDAVNNVGTIFYGEKKYRTAIARYTKALSLAPDSAPYWSNLGTAYYARGKYEEMSKAYTRALELDPNVFQAHGSVGTRMLDQSVEDRARFHYELARMYAIAGRNELAIEYLRKALEEGFKNKEKLQGKEFASLRETEEFKELMAREPRVL